MEQNEKKKVAILVVGYNEVADYRQFKIAILKSVNLNFVSKVYFVDKNKFTQQMERFCEDFKLEYEKLTPLPVKPSNEQAEKLSEVKALVVFNNGEDKRIKKYEAFVKKMPVYINNWKLKDNVLINK